MEAVAGRSPGEVRAMVQKWSLGLIAAAVVVAVVGVVVLTWYAWMGAVVLGLPPHSLSQVE